MSQQKPNPIQRKQDVLRQKLRKADQHFAAGDLDKAIEDYRSALESLPHPVQEQDDAVLILMALGDVHFCQGKLEEGLDWYTQAFGAVNGTSNAYVNLRLGQINLELGNEKQAAEFLIRTYMMEGQHIFLDENPKYWQFVSALDNIDPTD